MNARNIVLTGFMATGKTTVGRQLAQEMGREFVDMDALIEERAGRSVPELFQTHGEAHFRTLEAELCAELGRRQDLVVATGGGTLVNAANRACFAGSFVLCLEAGAESVLARVGDPAERPMLLGGESPRQRVEQLQAARQSAYAAIPLHLDTSGKPVAQVVAEALALWQAQPAAALSVRTPEGTYPILLGPGLLARLGSTLAAQGGLSSRCALVTNPRVGGLYAAEALASLAAAGFTPQQIEVPDGERYKSLGSLGRLYDRLVAARLDRRSAVLALGGGVVGDLAGFAAATYLRGVPFVQLPTTLLSMVDSSLGGKVAVNHKAGKNLVGAFKQPLSVLADTSTLASLPPAEWRCGLAEALKHALIADPDLFARFETDADPRATVEGWLGAAIKVKQEIVQRDPFEQGERLKLNLGHTFGHALESVSGLRLPHGSAVALGLLCAALLARRLGLCEPELVARLRGVLRRLGLPHAVPARWPDEDIAAAMVADKKRLDGRLRFVLPRALGDVIVTSDVAAADVLGALAATRSEQ
ncbi:MAG: 3-dehydroquinate synthase [Chloroflexota bacterium]